MNTTPLALPRHFSHLTSSQQARTWARRVSRALALTLGAWLVTSSGATQTFADVAAGDGAGSALADGLRAVHGAHAWDVLSHRPSIAATAGGLMLERAASAEHPATNTDGATASVSALANTPALGMPGSPLAPSGTAAAPSPEQVWLPSHASGAIELTLRGAPLLRVFEEGARGASERVEGTVSYAREGGRSYWTVAEGHGFEDWLDLDAGVAYADRVVARWRVEGMSLREVPETGGVHVLGADGQPIVYVSAPAAWSASGEAVDARLSVEGDRIALRVDADGAPVLVDPSWVATGSMIEARGEFSEGNGAVRLADGSVLIVGGYHHSILASAERYDPSTGVWSSAGSMAVGRVEHTTTLLPSGKVLVTGGGGDAGVLSTAELYDPATNTWSSAESMSTIRASQTATLLPSGRVLVTGGVNGSIFPLTAELYDPATNSWSSAGSMATGRRWHTATLLPSGQVLVTGGTNHEDVSTAELYDPATNSWSSAAPMRGARFGHTATLLPSGEVLVAGGYHGGPTRGADLYDPATNRWSSAGSMATPRYMHTATLLPSGEVLVVGGSTDAMYVIDSTAELYDPTTNSWSSAGATVNARSAHTATLLLDGRVLLAGAWVLGGALAQSELYGDVCPAGTFLLDGMGGLGCAPCASGSYSASGATSCTPWSTCAAGAYVSVAGTATSDQSCSACAAGSFSSTPDAASCATWRTCDASEYESAAPTPTSDRICTALTTCTATEFESVPPTATSDRVCAALGSCGAGAYESMPATPTSDRVCTPLTECTSSEYQSTPPSATSDRACTPVTTCTANQYESTAPTATSDRRCAACTQCAAGMLEVSACTATANAVCQDASDGGVADAGLDDAGVADAGVDDGGPDDGGLDDGTTTHARPRGGCGCVVATSAAPSRGGPLAMLAFFTLVALRRRRTRRI